MRSHSVQVATDHPEVDDAHLALHVVRAEAHLFQMAREVVTTLFQRDVGARLPFAQRILIEDVERDRGLHRPGLSREQDDLALRDTTSELLIEAVDERLDSVSLTHAIVSIGRSGYNRSEAVITAR